MARGNPFVRHLHPSPFPAQADGALQGLLVPAMPAPDWQRGQREQPFTKDPGAALGGFKNKLLRH